MEDRFNMYVNHVGQIIVTIKVKSNNWMVWTVKLDSVQMLGKYKNSSEWRKQTLISKEWRHKIGSTIMYTICKIKKDGQATVRNLFFY